MECTAYLKQQLDAIGWPAWKNEFSNTVFFRRPSDNIVNTYILAQGYDENFGGNLAHVVVMQHVTKDKIDVFVVRNQGGLSPLPLRFLSAPWKRRGSGLRAGRERSKSGARVENCPCVALCLLIGYS